jgi:hypothetical protein
MNRVDRQHERDLENIKAASSLGSDALKGLLLVNGGAAAGVLTFFGNVLTKTSPPPPIQVDLIRTGLLWFAAGVVLALVASGLGWLGQYFMLQRLGRRVEAATLGSSGVVGLSSAACFVIGVLSCGNSLQ